MKFIFRGIFSASLLMYTIESFGYTKDAEVNRIEIQSNITFRPNHGHQILITRIVQLK